METYLIERRGGLAGVPAHGEIAAADMDPDDRARLDRLLDGQTRVTRDAGADRFSYVVTRRTPSGETTLEIPESLVPQAVARAVRTEL
jgi:hypothetical protein